jgi:hypothetical protein
MAAGGRCLGAELCASQHARLLRMLVRMRPLLVLGLLAAPVAAAAQLTGGRPLSFGDRLDLLDHLVTSGREARRTDALRHPEDLDLQQVFILPERPGQNQVAWYGFTWEYLDVAAPAGGAGVRLYYHAHELAQAQRALPAILSAYARLVEVFHYVPTHRIPYILYATQREFQTQNVFEVTESVLGVTSPQDLKMTVPYFGDHTRFIEVSTHEMVHQFHIQKMRDMAGDGGESAIETLPLWFTEGIAEYYSKGGIDVETDVFLRDLVWNPDSRRRYEVLAFADDDVQGYIPTYKLGQARIAFIADVYGPERIQGFLEVAASLAVAGTGTRADREFPGLVRRVLGEPLEQVDARWRAWLRRRYYAAFLSVHQDLETVRELRRLPYEPEAFAASRSGEVVLFRGIDRERGRARLLLMDVSNPAGAQEVAVDDEPGTESLHPIEYRVMAVGEHVLVFSAQAGIGDQLNLRTYRREVHKGKPVALHVSAARRVPLRHPDGGPFVAIADPALSPDETQVAFVGVGLDGQQDLYVAPLDGRGPVRRLTDDFFSKRDVSWGEGGLLYASDATEHGRLNLFRLDPAGGTPIRLTTGASNDRHPVAITDGRVLFVSDEGGKPDLWDLASGARRRLTDFSTGLSAAAPAPGGHGVLATAFHGGRFRLVEVSQLAFLDGPPEPVAPPAGEPLPIPSPPLPEGSQPYRGLAARNWRPEAGFIYGGGAAGAIAGRAAALFDDFLRDRVLLVDVSVYGTFDYTQASIVYEDRSRRTGLVLGAFHFVQTQLDVLDPTLAYNQRDFGVAGALRYPLDRFQRVELELSVGATQRYCLTDFSGAVVLSCGHGLQHPSPVYPTTADWEARNGGVNLNLGPTFRYGYDSVRYHPRAGPIDGGSFLFEAGVGWLPQRQAVNGFSRFDAQRYLQLIGRSRLWFRAAAGVSVSPGGDARLWRRDWWLTPEDNLRGFGPADAALLVGPYYYVTNAELQVPLDPIIHLLFFEYMTGIAGLDFGGVFSRWADVKDSTGAVLQPGLWDARTLTGVLGVNVTFGPLLFRVHFGHPFDIGGLKTPALLGHHSWVTNITLRYVFF